MTRQEHSCQRHGGEKVKEDGKENARKYGLNTEQSRREPNAENCPYGSEFDQQDEGRRGVFMFVGITIGVRGEKSTEEREVTTSRRLTIVLH